MTGRTEERLRDATRALAQQVRPQDIPDRVPQAPAWSWRASGRWAGGRLLIPVAAAATVLALIIALTVIGRALQGPRPHAGPGPGMPAYLITSRDGHGYVQSTATGRVVAQIRPPVPGFLIEAIAVQPGERAFYLAGDVPATPPALKLEFFRFSLDSRGRPGRPHRLGAPVTEQLSEWASRPTTIPMAISPDGKELAWAWPHQLAASYVPRRPATITVQDLATGSKRTWSTWPAHGTGFSSLSFAGDNRLAFVATIINAAVSAGTVVPRHDNQLHVFMVLNLTAAGSSLTADSRLVTHGSGLYPPGTGGPWTGPSAGLISPDGHSAYLTLVAEHFERLVRMSVGTGRVTGSLESGPAAAGSYPISIDGNQMLIFLPALHRATSAGSANVSVCAVLARVNLSTGRVSRLPAPPSCPRIPVIGPFEVAW